MKTFAFLVAILAMSFTHTSKAQQEEFVFFAEEGNWQIYEAHAVNPGEEVGCTAFRQESQDSVIYFTFSEARTSLMIQRANWQLPANSSYAVYLQIDNNDVIEATISTYDQTDAVFIEEDITPILPAMQAGTTLYIHTEATTLQYSLAGSSPAITSAQACLRKMTSATSTNPFLADGSSGGGTNPFMSEQNQAASYFIEEPFLLMESYEMLFFELVEGEISVEVAPSNYLGSHQALIGEMAYNFYWEEDATTRDTTTIYGDVVASFNESCKNMAASKLIEEARANHIFHQGSLACSDPENDLSLFFRISIFDWPDIGAAMIFVSTGGIEEREAVELIDNIIAENMTIILTEMGE